ncbi:unnamed protein product, partial [Nesidiocoris tenuis]
MWEIEAENTQAITDSYVEGTGAFSGSFGIFHQMNRRTFNCCSSSEIYYWVVSSKC